MLRGLGKMTNDHKGIYWHAFKRVLGIRAYAWTALCTFVLVLPIYLTILPATLVGSDIGINSFYHLTPKLVFFSILMALQISLLLPLSVYLLKNNRQCRSGATVSGFTLGLATPLLCCSPILPFLLSLLGILWPAIPSVLGINIQYFVNVYQTEIFLFSVLLLLLALHQNIKLIKISPA